MKPHYEKRFLFLAIILVCLYCAFGCTAHRKTQTRTEYTSADTLRAVERIDTTTAVDARHGRGHYDIDRTADVSGTLEIERDSTGLPVRYVWSSHGNSHTKGTDTFEDFGLALGYHSSAVKDSTHTQAEQKQKETGTEVKAGEPLERIIGRGILLFVILYLFIFTVLKCIRWIQLKE